MLLNINDPIFLCNGIQVLEEIRLVFLIRQPKSSYREILTTFVLANWFCLFNYLNNFLITTISVVCCVDLLTQHMKMAYENCFNCTGMSETIYEITVKTYCKNLFGRSNVYYLVSVEII